jgi:hypothetical protein
MRRTSKQSGLPTTEALRTEVFLSLGGNVDERATQKSNSSARLKASLNGPVSFRLGRRGVLLMLEGF